MFENVCSIGAVSDRGGIEPYSAECMFAWECPFPRNGLAMNHLHRSVSLDSMASCLDIQIRNLPLVNSNNYLYSVSSRPQFVQKQLKLIRLAR